jgi:hypothetical protein
MNKKFKEKISKALSQNEKVFNTLVLSLMLFLAVSFNAYASTPRLISGTVDLFRAITGWLLLIIPVGAGAVLGYQALQKSLTDDQAVISEKNKMMKNVIIGAAIAETASGLVTVILSFYS